MFHRGKVRRGLENDIMVEAIFNRGLERCRECQEYRKLTIQKEEILSVEQSAGGRCLLRLEHWRQGERGQGVAEPRL